MKSLLFVVALCGLVAAMGLGSTSEAQQTGQETRPEIMQKLNETVEEESDWRVAFDISATHSGLTTYKGYSQDLGAALKFKYRNSRFVPFIRASRGMYNYLNETIPGNTDYQREDRSAAGVGLDFFITRSLRLRYISDYVTNITDSRSYSQDAFLIIYNQYIDLQKIEINNYLESVLIPRFSRSKFNTYFRGQLLKSFYLTRAIDSSNVVYPFVQLKVKENDEEFFGKSGNLASVGGGYRYYSKPTNVSALAFVFEAHSLIYQSAEFNSDWFQILAVLQYTYN